MRFPDKQIQTTPTCLFFVQDSPWSMLSTGATRVLHPSSERSRGAAYCRQMVATRGKGNRWFLPLYSSNLSLNVCGVCSSHQTILVEFQCLILMDQEFIILCLFLATAVAATAAGDLWNQNRFATLLLLGGGSSETRRRDWAEISKGMALLCWKVVKESHNCKECHSWCWDAF